MLKVIWNTKLLLLNNKSLNDLLINEICIKIAIKLLNVNVIINTICKNTFCSLYVNMTFRLSNLSMLCL